MWDLEGKGDSGEERRDDGGGSASNREEGLAETMDVGEAMARLMDGDGKMAADEDWLDRR